MRLPLSDNACVTWVSLYAPTMTHQDESKKPSTNSLIKSYAAYLQVINGSSGGWRRGGGGDFNARIGWNHIAWAGIIGQHGIGHETSVGNLLSLCSQHNFSVTDTFFQLNGAYKTAWMHPRSMHWHQRDVIICRRDLQDFHIPRALRSTECSTDHLLLRSKVKLKGRRKSRPQSKKPSQKNGCSENQ